MERKKLIKLAIIVVVIIFALVITEKLIRGINNVVVEKEKLSEIEKEKEIYESSPEYAEEVMLSGVVSDFMKLLNSKDVDTLFNLIDIDYKDYKFNNDKEKFNAYINKYMQEEAEFELQTYEKFSGRYKCRILSKINGVYSSFQVLITQNESDGSYSLIFDEIDSIEKIEKILDKKDNIACNVLYKVTADDICAYTVEYRNIGAKDINYTYENVILRNTRLKEYNSDISDLSISLKPGETVREEFSFTGEGLNLYSNTVLSITLNNSKSEKCYLMLSLGESGI